LAQTLVQGSASPAQIRAKLITKEPQIIKLMQRRMAEGKPFYSFEYFPPKVRARHSPRAAVLCPSVCLHARGSLSALISVFLCVLQTREGVTNLYSRLDRMDLLEPLFMDLTWGAGPSLPHEPAAHRRRHAAATSSQRGGQRALQRALNDDFFARGEGRVQPCACSNT
jgi:hypothetical protein